MGSYMFDLEPTERGTFSVKETPLHLVELAVSGGHPHIVTVPKGGPFRYDRSWCYVSMPKTLAALILWDGGADTEPRGYWRRSH